MFIEIVQAGVISDAPSIYDLIVRTIQMALTFVASVAFLGVLGAGAVYIMPSGNGNQHRVAKVVLVNSVIGLTIALTSLVIVSAVAKVLE